MKTRPKRMIWQKLDVIDQKISEPVFASRLPVWPLEFLLSIPGNWFGSCSFTFITLPSLVSIHFDDESQEWHPWYALVGCLGWINLTLWWILLGEKSAINKQARLLFYGPVTGAVAPAVGLWVLAISPLSNSARSMGYFTMCAWSVGIIPVATLKPFVARQRPASRILSSSSTEEEAKNLQRAAAAKHLRILPKLLALDANSSFPSGDTAGAMSTMYSLIFLSSTVGAKTIGVLCVFLSCFGRMYWMAHHLLDVLAGVLTSYFPCLLLQQIFCDGNGCSMDWWVPLVAHAMLLATVICTRLMFSWKVFEVGTIHVGNDEENKKNKE